MINERPNEEFEDLQGIDNLTYLESLFEQYRREPETIPERWQEFFRQNAEDFQASPSVKPFSIFNPPAPSGGITQSEASRMALQGRVDQFIRAYRVRGHNQAKLDPLGLPRPVIPELDPAYHGLTDEHMDMHFSCDSIKPGVLLSLRALHQSLLNTYCRSIGVQFMHIDDLAVRQWLQQRMESCENRLIISKKDQIRILTRLTDAVTFEQFIRKKFVGAKSFSLEGAESLIPLLDLAIEKAGDQGVEEIVMAMAHRGRLNVLANILGKSPADIFREFEDNEPDKYIGRGDVKYHLGHSCRWKTSKGKEIHLSLCFNPSHLEYVNTVAMGRIRAKQHRMCDTRREKGLCLLIHGDAAFAGEGVVQETLNLSQLKGYQTGGTLHIIVNNQIGFTTSPSEGCSAIYSSDVAKMLQIPIFHVNGEDPEAVAQCIKLAMEFRFEFKRDVVVDMFCYRRLGHNEGDEPSFTQPVLYNAISKRKTVREGYLDHLLNLNGVTRSEADEISERRRELLELDLSKARAKREKQKEEGYTGIWKNYLGGPIAKAPKVKTAVSTNDLKKLLLSQTTLPPQFNLHPKLQRLIEARLEMAENKLPLDWGNAEALAFASLAIKGIHVRLTGQDSGRGTFTQRHSIFYDTKSGDPYIPLQHLAENQGNVEIYNSPLSENGVLGFEYGYSTEYPDGLTLWEAQFGDFINAAQVIVDQFIASAEDKWGRLSGVVLLLPHGFEGMGPEHSSARLERLMVLAAEDNIQVTQPTTPAQYFHMLRRQVISPWRKPLFVMTPKSLLRHPEAVSMMEELASGGFQRVLVEPSTLPQKAKKILMCSGKIYFDLCHCLLYTSPSPRD